MLYSNINPTWLDEANNFDVHHASMEPQICDLRDTIYPEVASRVNIRQASYRNKDVLRLVLLNLFVGWRTGRPVRYSRNSRDYRHHARYGKIFFKINRVVPIIDALDELGYIETALGYYFNDGKRQSRMWASAKLAELFWLFTMDGPGIVYHEQPKEIIQLRDLNKIRVNYNDNDCTNGMRARMIDYNDNISSQLVEVILDSNSIVNRKYVRSLMSGVESGTINLTSVILNNDVSNIEYSNIEDSKYTTTITNTIIDLGKNLFGKMGGYADFSEDKHLLLVLKYGTMNSVNNGIKDDKDFTLGEIGISNITYTVQYNYLHRVFSRGGFGLNGRFYGAYHQQMPSGLRANITINGEPSVELDYSAHHVRMLYHMEGIDYRDDPYQAVCSTKEERKRYKVATLAMINASDKGTTIKAIRDMLRNENSVKFKLTDANLMPMIDDFQKVHSPISQYLNSDIGCRLQNLDAQITDGILTRLTNSGVPCLPVHDSYIVPVHHEDMLRQAMFEEYEKLMGYSPIVH